MRVKATELTVTVGGRTLFSDLNFSWSGPGLVAVIGPSGAGKSTLLSSVMGWTRHAHGALEVEPLDSVWLVPQNAPLLDSRTVHENLEVALLAGVVPDLDNQLIDGVLRTYRLEHRAQTRGKHLSGGERQRVALARAALRRPKILLADEVTAGLDRESVGMVSDALRSLASHALVVVATHDERVWSGADKVLDLAAITP